MFPLVATELGDFLIKGMREFVFLGGGGFYKVDASVRESRRMAGTKGWKRDGEARAMARNRWRTGGEEGRRRRKRRKGQESR